MTEALPEASVVSIHGLKDHPVGGGVLIGPRRVLTCAHVVNIALGRPSGAGERPAADQLITIALPLLKSPDGRPARFTAVVEAWSPPPDRTSSAVSDESMDVAGLVIDEPAEARLAEALAAAIPARLAPADPQVERVVRIFGFPSEPIRPEGHWVTAEVQGIRDARLNLQLGSAFGPNPKIQPGYSGFAAYDRDNNEVLGVVVVAPAAGTMASDSRAISAERLRLAWPAMVRPDLAAPLPAARKTEGISQLTILHLSELSFGRRDDPGASAEGAVELLLDDVRRVARDLDQRPDLILVTGDLTILGLERELTRAFAFLERLADGLEIADRSHVVVVPGDLDVNKSLCRSYFSKLEAREIEPTIPYYPKWEFFLDGLERFQPPAARDSDATGQNPPPVFSPATPWSITEITDPDRGLKVVVAGLNSTMANSFREPADRYGLLTADQLRWFAAKLEWYQKNGWLRIAATHHNVAEKASAEGNLRDAEALYQYLGATGLVNVVFHGHSDNGRTHMLHDLPLISTGAPAEATTFTYQLITLTADGISRSARRFEASQDRWVGDTRVSSTGEDWRTHDPHLFADVSGTFRVTAPMPAMAAEEMWPWPREAPRAEPQADLLARVNEIVKVRYPKAATWPDLRSRNHILVLNPLATKEKQWPIGLREGGVDEAALAAFEDGPQSSYRGVAQAQFVYTGPPATRELEEFARSRGIDLLHFDDYARLFDLSSATQAQTERLASDRTYWPSRYVPQRYSEPNSPDSTPKEDLAGAIIEDLRSDDARMIIVLGDFGRGKTALLRELARRIPDELLGADPVLIELRNHEKSIGIEKILLLHLDEVVPGVTTPALRYMVSRGQIILLLDGFDEFELRVGYDNAATYLQKIQEVVSGRAKVVLTSRTQQFLTMEQLRPVVSDNLERLQTNRLYLLEDFTDDQIRAFLEKLHPGDEDGAASHYQALKSKTDLYELGRNPRLLAFIVELGKDFLAPLSGSEKPLSPGKLYEKLINRWLGFEEERQSQGGLLPLAATERLDACIELAKRMSMGHHLTVDLDELRSGASATLSDLAVRAFTVDQAAHVIGSGSLLVRNEDGRFSFVHQSIMEWLLARAAWDALTEWRDRSSAARLLKEHRLTQASIDFLRDLADADLLKAWSNEVLTRAGDQGAAGADTERLNALAVVRRTGAQLPNRQNLSHMDLRDEYIRGRDFAGSDLHNARFDGALLEDVDFAGANLEGACFDGARLVRGRLDGATLVHSSWHRASILGTTGIAGSADEAALTVAAVAGRDSYEVQHLHGGLAKCVAFAPATPAGRTQTLAIGRGPNVELVYLPDGRPIRVLSGHRSEVTSVKFSRSGETLISSSTDGYAIIWNVGNGAKVRTLPRHPQGVLDAAFGPDDVVATACGDGQIRIWQQPPAMPPVVLQGHEGPVSAVAFSQDGRRLISGSYDRSALIWDVDRREPIRALTHFTEVTSVAYSADGRLVATGSLDNVARVFEVDGPADARPLHKLNGHTSSINAVAFAPDDKVLGTASNDKSAILWDLQTGALVKRLTEHASWVTGIAFGAGRGGLIATASFSRAVQLWTSPGGLPEGRINGYDNWPAGLSFTSLAGAPEFASVSEDRAVRIWDASRGAMIRLFGPHDEPLSAVAHAPDGRTLAVASIYGTVWLHELPDGAVLAKAKCHRVAITGVVFSDDGRRLITTSRDGTAKTWSVPSLDAAVSLAEEDSPVVAADCSRDLVLTVGEDRRARLWNLWDGKPIRTFADHTDSVTGGAFAPGGQSFASCSWDGTVMLREVAGKASTVIRPWSGLAVTALTFAPNGADLAIGSRHGDIAVIRDGAVASESRGASGTGAVRVMRYSADGSLLMVVAEDNAMLCYRAASLDLIARLLPLPGDGYATLLRDGSYKLEGGPAGLLWWAIKSCRFSPGELDEHGVPHIDRLDAAKRVDR